MYIHKHNNALQKHDWLLRLRWLGWGAFCHGRNVVMDRRILPTIAVPGVLGLLALGSVIPIGAWWAGVALGYYEAAWKVWSWGAVVTALVMELALILSRGGAPRAVFAVWRWVMTVRSSRYVVAVALCSAILSVLSSLILFSGNPGNVDGFAQLFQARIFLAGRLWAPPPPDVANFATLQMVIGPERWYSQY